MTGHSDLYGSETTAAEVLAGQSLQGRTIVLTGGSEGVGAACARALADAGAVVLSLARSHSTGDVERRASGGEVRKIRCDLASFASVAHAATAIREQAPVLHSLVCNAGVYFLPELAVVRGVERHFAVNQLGHFELVGMLLPQVLRNDGGRIVVVASEAHRRVKHLDSGELPVPRDYDPVRAYSVSKLANLAFSFSLARRLHGRASVTAVSPMWVATRSMRDHLARVGSSYDPTEAKTPEQGASVICLAAASPDYEGVSGVYLENCRPAEVSEFARDKDVQEKLWRLSEQYCDPALAFPAEQ